MVDNEFIQVTHRELPYQTFDADNHLYETQDAMTKFLPPEYQGVIKYIEVNGRTKLAHHYGLGDRHSHRCLSRRREREPPFSLVQEPD